MDDAIPAAAAPRAHRPRANHRGGRMPGAGLVTTAFLAVHSILTQTTRTNSMKAPPVYLSRARPPFTHRRLLPPTPSSRGPTLKLDEPSTQVSHTSHPPLRDPATSRCRAERIAEARWARSIARPRPESQDCTPANPNRSSLKFIVEPLLSSRTALPRHRVFILPHSGGSVGISSKITTEKAPHSLTEFKLGKE